MVLRSGYFARACCSTPRTNGGATVESGADPTRGWICVCTETGRSKTGLYQHLYITIGLLSGKTSYGTDGLGHDRQSGCTDFSCNYLTIMNNRKEGLFTCNDIVMYRPSAAFTRAHCAYDRGSAGGYVPSGKNARDV